MLKQIISDLIEYITPLLGVFWDIFSAWWWLFAFIFLFPIFKFHWYFWRNRKWEDAKNLKSILEVRIPSEILKPMRAMETVFSGFWQIHSPPNWFEKWWEGQSTSSFSLEITSIEGVPRFLLRIPKKQRDVFETHIYAQYPSAEIEEVDDYTNKVPDDIPNNKWEIWGTDYRTAKDDCYPIKTYFEFETEREVEEEKRIDPMAALMEGLSRLEEGEQIWIQIKAKPLLDEDCGFVKRAEKVQRKLAGRKEKKRPPLIIKEAISLILFGLPKEEDKKETIPYPEMMLTPGEKAVLEGIEKKKAKPVFECFIRYVYVVRRDKFSGGRIRIPMSYFSQFSTVHMNAIVPWGDALTKVKRNWYDWFWFQKRRLYTKKRRIFRDYRVRTPAFYPRQVNKATFFLNTEELATLFHFPSYSITPAAAIPRVESKKKEAPSNLPMEEE